MLFADYENIEGQLAFYAAINTFFGKLAARLRGDEGSHLASAA